MSTTASKREVRKVSSRWPVTVAAVLGGVALLLVAYVALRSDQNDVLSFAGVPSEVVVESDAGLVVVVPAEGDDVQVSRRAEWTVAKPDMKVEVVGGSLVIQAHCDGGRWLCDVQHRVAVPADVRVRVVGEGSTVNVAGITGPVDIETSGGDVVVTNLTSTLRVRTAGGDITLSGVAGDIDVASESGGITGDTLTGLLIQSGTDSGDISLTVTGPADRIGAGSSSGNITLVVPDVGYVVDAQASSGDVTVEGITESAASAHSISASTGSGQISITGG
jgi:Putative adhesin